VSRAQSSRSTRTINSFLLTRAEAALGRSGGGRAGDSGAVIIRVLCMVFRSRTRTSFETAGIRTTAHSKLLRDFVLMRDRGTIVPPA